MRIARPLLTIFLALALIGAVSPAAAGGLTTTRTAEARITYYAQHVYGGRLTNAQAAFARFERWLAKNPFAERRTYSFTRDVLEDSMLEEQGFVDTAYGFGYGACGAPSLLNQLVHTARFIDSDGTEKPLFEVRRWTRERNPTYGPFGAAIYVDPTGKRASDYRWRINPAYDGATPKIEISFQMTGDKSAEVLMTVTYTDEIGLPDGEPATKAKPTRKITPPQGLFGGELKNADNPDAAAPQKGDQPPADEESSK